MEELLRQREIRQAVENTVSSPVQTTVDSQKVAAAKQNVAQESNGEGQGDIVIRLHRRWMDVAVAAVAAVFFFFIFSYPAMVTPGVSESVVAGAVSVKKAALTNANSVAPTTQDDEQQNADVQDKMEKGFVIVLASKVSQKNAETTVKVLADKGLDKARIIGDEKMRRVVYSCYSTEEEARQAQKQLLEQDKIFAQTWIMELQ